MAGRLFDGVEHLAGLTAATGPAWLKARRTEAAGRLRAEGFPGARDEDWKYTRARPLLQDAWSLATEPGPADLPEVPAPRLVFVDGLLSAEHSDTSGLPAGVQVLPLARAVVDAEDAVRPRLGRTDPEGRGFDALNLAVARDGALVVVPDGVAVDAPIHLVSVVTGGERLAPVRHLVVAGRSSSVRVVQHFSGSGTALASTVTELFGGPNSDISYAESVDYGGTCRHVHTVGAELQRDARLVLHTLSFAAALNRTDVRVRLDQGAAVELSGLYLARDREHVDIHTVVDHAEPDGRSRELFKGILDDRARGACTGRVIVRPDAQRSDSAQRAHSLVLSDHAMAHARPQLEIHADDVKCAHGATVGRLDPEAFFYLRTRGLDALQARALLTVAFANEVLESLPDASLRTALSRRISRWLGTEEVT